MRAPRLPQRVRAADARATQHLLERPVEDQLAAAFAAARADLDEMIRRADDRFLVLDDEQRVALVAQVVHHADEPADVARMQADARLVEDEERVHQRRAEAGREIHALHFAAAERARGAIEREIAEADFAEIAQPRDDLVAQHLRRGVVRRQGQTGEKLRVRRKSKAARAPAA